MALAALKKSQQQEEQRAMQKQSGTINDQKKPPNKDFSQGNPLSSDLSAAQQLKNKQLENWLGQLPEDASRLMRNKFNYEYQKKQQAYMNGQWQPTKEQRW